MGMILGGILVNRVFEWWMKMGGILVAILVNWVWYLSGPPQQVRFWAEYG